MEGESREGWIEAVELPGNYLGDEIPLFVGIQRGDEVEQIVPVTGGTARFSFEFRMVSQDDGLDQRGPFVHGRRGDRFLYLSWGHAGDAEPFVRYARSKLKFEDVQAELLQRLHRDEGQRLVATVEATSNKGTEASGTVRPPQVSWRLVAAEA